jgi:hypothetical protein
MKMLLLYENVAALYNETYKINNSYKKTVSLLFGLANSTVTALCPCWWFSFRLGGVVSSCKK